MHVIDIFQIPLLHVTHKTVVIMSLRHIDSRVFVELSDVVHEHEGHVLVVDVHDQIGTALENLLGQFLVHEFIVSLIGFVSVMFVGKIERIPSEEDRFFGSLCLSISVECFIKEFVHVNLN